MNKLETTIVCVSLIAVALGLFGGMMYLDERQHRYLFAPPPGCHMATYARNNLNGINDKGEEVRVVYLACLDPKGFNQN